MTEDRFPHPLHYTIEGIELSAQDVVDILGPQITPPRRQKIQDVVADRTFNIVTVCEGIYDRGNVSAVMRSAESLGVQPFHIIDTEQHTKVANRVTMGSDKWLDLHRWEETEACISHLKAQGYQIVATHLDETAVPIEAIDFTQPTAMVFGNEKRGISPKMIEMSDIRCIIPMSGFAQSFNISVAAAISLYHVRQDRITRQGRHGDLSPAHHTALLADFYIRALKNPMRMLAAHVKMNHL